MATDVVYRNQQKRLQMKKLLKAAIAAETMTTEQAIVALKRYNATQMTSNKVMGMSKNKMNGSNVAVQQLGYQMGDFAVQVQGGTSAFVAFSQQATQLVGILPMVAGPLGLTVGAAVGLSAALGILIPIGSAVARMFFDIKDSAKAAEGGVDSYTSALESMIKATNDLRASRLGVDPTVVHINQERLRLIDEITVKTQKMAELEGKGGRNKGRAAGFRNQIEELQLLLDAENERLSAVTKAYNKETNLAREEEQSRNRHISQIKNRFDAEEQLMNQSVTVHGDTQDAIDRRNELSSNVYQNQIKHRFRDEEQVMGMSVEIHNKAQKDKAAASEFAAKTASMADAERLLGEQMADKNRKDALASFNADLLATQKTLDATFASRTLTYSVRFADDAEAMSQGFGGPSKTRMSYAELKAAGLSDDQIKAMGVRIPKPTSAYKKKDPIKEFQSQLDLESEMLGVSEARQKVLQALGADFARNNPKQAQAMEDQITKTNELIAVEEKRQGLVDSITGSIENGMMAMIDGTMSVKDAFKSMAAEIIKELYRVLVVQQMVNAAKGFFGFEDGGAFSGGSQIEAYADGGVVGSPTTFPMAGGKTGLMGEAGPEAIMPLKRGANGKLGVQMEGGSQGNVVINQSFNFQANGDDSVKKLIAQAAPKIADMAKASVIESRRRGGSTKAAFG
jgi:phage-related minor tail protein